jgi:hypothetical protein
MTGDFKVGILEEINAKLDRILAMGAVGSGNPAAANTAAPTPAPAADPFAAATPTPAPAPTHVTSDMIMALISPHLSNDAIKAKLGEAMRAMGIENLNNAQEHQYGDLYARFQAVVSAPATATGAGASII